MYKYLLYACVIRKNCLIDVNEELGDGEEEEGRDDDS